MATSYLPRKDGALLVWAENFNLVIGADAPACGLTAEQATAYATAFTAYSDAYAAAKHPSTRTPAAIEDKNMRKRELITLTRELVNICQAYPGMDNTRRVLLGITVKDTDPTPVPPPEDAPQLDVVAVQGRTVKLRLRNAVNGERRKPAGVQGATVMSYVGETIPSSLRDWTFEGNSTRTDVSVEFGEAVPMGSKVWITAFWYNRRAESGPACSPMAAHVGFGGLVEEIAPTEEAA